jgi:hypothetical protein
LSTFASISACVRPDCFRYDETIMSGMNLIVLGVVTIVSLFVVVIPVVIVIAARFERRYLRGQLRPANDEAMENALPYYKANRSSARHLGLTERGEFLLDRHAAYVDGCVSVWMNADNTVLVTIEAGHVIKIRHRWTTVSSMTEAGTLIETQDEFGTSDISGVKDKAALLNADLAGLLEFHSARIDGIGCALRPFPTNDVAKLHEDLERLAVDSMIRQGLAEYYEPGGMTWRFTWAGAWRIGFTGHFSQLAAANKQRKRLDQKRPGD